MYLPGKFQLRKIKIYAEELVNIFRVLVNTFSPCSIYDPEYFSVSQRSVAQPVITPTDRNYTCFYRIPIARMRRFDIFRISLSPIQIVYAKQ
jgi:hypothetical protein